MVLERVGEYVDFRWRASGLDVCVPIGHLFDSDHCFVRFIRDVAIRFQGTCAGRPPARAFGLCLSERQEPVSWH